MGVFESVVAVLPIVMCFQSLILDMAGNVGTQSLAVTIRVLMDEELTAGQKFGLVWKEVRVGFCNGLFLGSVTFLFVGLYVWIFKKQPPDIVIPDLRMCRAGTAYGNDYFKSCRNTDSDVFPQNQGGSRGCERSAYFHNALGVAYYGLAWISVGGDGKRSGSGCNVLRTDMDLTDQCI